jgi:hypothetical protein
MKNIPGDASAAILCVIVSVMAYAFLCPEPPSWLAVKYWKWQPRLAAPVAGLARYRADAAR